MANRLVIECGAVDRTALSALSEWSGDLTVIVTDGARAGNLREDSIDVYVADPTDPANYPESVDTVLVTGADTAAVERAARAVREAFPTASLTVQLSADADEASRASVDAVADELVDARSALASAVVDVATGEAATRLYKLRRVLRGLDGPLAVVTHDNPDPDAIGSAIALVEIAAVAGVDADACYFGEISHQENRALVNLLEIDLRNVDAGDELDDYAGIALVDHCRPGINDGLPEETTVDIVIDHHPPRAPVEAGFLDLRSDVGATSTLLADYLNRFNLDPDERVATALLYGIRVDTREFTREVSEHDFEAAAYLTPFVDRSVLERVEEPSVNANVLETVGRAIRNRSVRDDTLVAGVGSIRNRDALAQAADQLLDMEGIRVALVYGLMEGTVYVSGRSRATDVDLGETLRDALGTIGSAGGHTDMAGAQIPLGILAEADDESEEPLSRIVDEMITTRFFETLELAPGAPDHGTGEIPFAREFPLDEQ